jgi:glycine/D-amino acid oxidase-like deaminating enzyme
MTVSLFAEDLKLAPYWWDQVPRPKPADTAALPRKVDVLVIGSGYTGLSAALQTARGGRDTLVLDAEDIGFGCSTRNGGQISTSIKPSFEALAKRHGPERALAILREGQNSLAWIADFVASEKIDCDFRIAGRFHAAHDAARYEVLGRQIAAQPKGLEVDAHMVPRSEQRTELGSDAYFGGALFERHASVDPAKLHRGMLELVHGAGARVVGNCKATDIRKDGGEFSVNTVKGVIRAREVVVATNGYTTGLVPWIQRRVIPIGSYIIATEPIPRDVMTRLMPKNRVVSDTRKVVYYYRASPDGRRILFGGRVSFSETDPKISGPLLHAAMVNIFPELAQTRISHSWHGFVAYTFDELMHTGQRDGLHYAMGYCGSGAGMAGYLGMRLGQKLIGLKEGDTGLDDINFQTRPFYRGNPWFLAPSIMYYRWRDKQSV